VARAQTQLTTAPTPLVSVVLIFLDAAPYLDEAIASVLAQTYPAWELLLVDDGSTDGSTEVARRYAEQHPGEIRYLEHAGHRNLGMSASRNLGAAHARGEYLTFLDADDVFRTSALATLTARLENFPSAAMAYGPVEYWYNWAGTSQPGRRNFVQRLGVPAEVLLAPPDLLLRFLRRRAAAPSGMIVRTAAFRIAGGFEAQFRGMYEDQAFCAKICLTQPVVALSTCEYRYRQHPASSSAAADRSGEQDFGRAAFLDWLGAYLDRQPAANPSVLRVRRALRAERWWLGHPRLHRLVRRTRRLLRRVIPN
jgi:glycosyltransferase involved in cell wall biosynthesis